MNDRRWQLSLAIALIALSALLYTLHFLTFHDPHHIFIYLLGDIAFVPIEVLLVTLIIHRLLEGRDRRLKLQKLNMVIGTFFSSVGTSLLTYLSDHDPNLENIRSNLVVSNEWSGEDFDRVERQLRGYPFDVSIEGIDLQGMKAFLLDKEDFLMRLLENPTLLEHERFTELLRATFHLTEELQRRDRLDSLPGRDIEHLGGDISRVYQLLVEAWLDYMKYLKDNYPYLFSLAMRSNPFDEHASVVIQ